MKLSQIVKEATKELIAEGKADPDDIAQVANEVFSGVENITLMKSAEVLSYLISALKQATFLAIRLENMKVLEPMFVKEFKRAIDYQLVAIQDKYDVVMDNIHED